MLRYTYGLAKSKGKAVSCILEGALYPISYTPFNNPSWLKGTKNNKLIM